MEPKIKALLRFARKLTLTPGEMTEFADHSGNRLRTLENLVRAKDEEIRETHAALGAIRSVIEEKDHELADLERSNQQLGVAADELDRLQAELQVSGEELDSQTSRLMDLMRDVDEPAERWENVDGAAG